MNVCDKVSNYYPFQSIERLSLIPGLGAYLRGCLLDISVSSVGAYWRGEFIQRGRLIKALQY